MRGHITKRGKDRNGKDKYYVVVDIGVDEHGKRKQKWLSGFRTKADAERALTKVLGELGAGQYVDPQRTPLGSYLLDEWLPARAAQIRPTTSESYRDLITRHVLPSLGRVPLARLTPVLL